MYLYCVESLSSFQSKLDFLQIFKVAQKLGQRPCTIVHGLGPNFIKMARREFSIFRIFLIHIHVLMFFRKFELILITIGFFMNF